MSSPAADGTDTFPRQYARTQRLTLGEPRNIVVSPDGARVVFCRSRGGSDPVNCVWVLDVADGVERLVADPLVLLDAAARQEGAGEAQGSGVEALELARRERAREGAAGVVGFATDAAVTVAAFALAGRLFVCGLLSGSARELVVAGPVFDPRPDPTARRLAYVSERTLRIAELSGVSRALAAEADPDVSWGSAEFIAAEEMGRSRGYWWSPDGQLLAVARVDTSPINRWWIGDPAHPDRQPAEIAYPAAGTNNALVTVHIFDLDGNRTDVVWDRQTFPYLAEVTWHDRLLMTVQSRDQRDLRVLSVDVLGGETTTIYADDDPAWVELVPGVPVESGGSLVMTADFDGVRRLLVDEQPVSPIDVQVRAVIGRSADGVAFLANTLDDPLTQSLWCWSAAGGAVQVTSDANVLSASVGGPTTVVRTATLHRAGTTTTILGGAPLRGLAETPLVQPNVTILRAGQRRIATAVLLPHDVATGGLLPVLLDPYGGPHSQRVVNAQGAYLSSQWFADQGFAVVIADGRGTPGRGSLWERAVQFDLASAALEDQVDALHAAAEQVPHLDLDRVAIRGWSFGGYLAALAVLRRPDVFHAAIAGAPVTEWRLYDTHYTERYLGDPADDSEPYERSSLLNQAAKLTRPLMLIHGLADDNVVSAHTLQFSSALLEAGRPHQVLPLSGVSHMTPQETVAENVLLLQLAFLRQSLGIAAN
jgi:dipeptidyl-peptidase 4